MKRSITRDVHTFQSALLAVDNILDGHERDPRLVEAADSLRSYGTSIYMLLAIGMATFLGVAFEDVSAPVTAGNWRIRLRGTKAWSKLSEKEGEFGSYALARDDLTPHELTRVRNLIEKMERFERQGEFEFLDTLDDDVPF